MMESSVVSRALKPAWGASASTLSVPKAPLMSPICATSSAAVVLGSGRTSTIRFAFVPRRPAALSCQFRLG